MKDQHLTGHEAFHIADRMTELDVLDFWRFEYSNLLNQQDRIAEYLVAKALGKVKADNTDFWALYDIDYQGVRIEVKQTSYMHPWNRDGEYSDQRTFSVAKAYTRYKDTTSEWKRQCDVYVFCVNTGTTKETAHPLDLTHWEFYVIPTSVINAVCGNNKSISLNRVKKLAGHHCKWEELQSHINNLLKSEE